SARDRALPRRHEVGSPPGDHRRPRDCGRRSRDPVGPRRPRLERVECERRQMSAESPYVVETEGLTKRFGETTVVQSVDLRVPRGVAFGYLGPNGAGKTTLIRMLLGLTRATAGEMRLLGLPVPRRRREALARVGAIVDEPRF